MKKTEATQTTRKVTCTTCGLKKCLKRCRFEVVVVERLKVA